MPEAQYKMGPPQRPKMVWDNAYGVRKHAPTASDELLLAKWVAMLEAGEAAQKVPFVRHNDLSDALGAYRHYLYGEGKDRTFSYERYVLNDPSGAITLKNAIIDLEEGVGEIYDSEAFPSAEGSFRVTGSAIACGRRHSRLFPYPVTENWQKAIGYHVIWLSADVQVTYTGSGPSFQAVMTLHAEDKYNFNPGAADIATGLPDAENGELESAGLAHSFMHYSTLQRTLRWTTISDSLTLNTNGGGRQRQPQDNFRVRNRL